LYVEAFAYHLVKSFELECLTKSSEKCAFVGVSPDPISGVIDDSGLHVYKVFPADSGPNNATSVGEDGGSEDRLNDG
jgi:hypothetical protein